MVKTTHFQLCKYRYEYIQLFYKAVEKEKDKIWTLNELSKIMNKNLANQRKLNFRQIGCIIKLQRKYNPYKYSGVIRKYIFKRSAVRLK